LINSPLYFHRYEFTIIITGFLFLMTIQLSSTQLHSTIVQYVLAKPLSTDIQIVSDNLQKKTNLK